MQEDIIKGLIISNISNLYNVKIGKDIFECTSRGKFKQEKIMPVVGDIVQIEIIDKLNNKGVIQNVIKRKNYCKRPKIANLTQIIFVVSLKNPKPDLLLLDKQIAYAEYLGINPVICINKIDLDSKDILDNIEKIYENIGYKVITTNAKENIGIEKLKQLLKGNITAFSGNSGVGKSTLINGLFDKEVTLEGIISQKNKKGKNTTTAIQLYEINEGYIADTPGFSTFDISEIEYRQIDKYFKEFTQEIDKCGYVGCSHIKEEDCGVKRAISNNRISKQRYENYCKIYEDLKDREEHKW